jgi:hypothetical protein
LLPHRDLERRVVDFRSRPVARCKCRGVHKRFERGARLTTRGERSIETATLRSFSRNYGAKIAGHRIERDERTLRSLGDMAFGLLRLASNLVDVANDDFVR